MTVIQFELTRFHQALSLKQGQLPLFLVDVLGWRCHGLSLPQQLRQLCNGLAHFAFV